MMPPAWNPFPWLRQPEPGDGVAAELGEELEDALPPEAVELVADVVRDLVAALGFHGGERLGKLVRYFPEPVIELVVERPEVVWLAQGYAWWKERRDGSSGSGAPPVRSVDGGRAGDAASGGGSHGVELRQGLEHSPSGGEVVPGTPEGDRVGTA